MLTLTITKATNTSSLLVGISAFIVAELATLGWLLTRKPDSNEAEEEAEAGAMIGERQPYLQFLFANSFGETHGEFSISTHHKYSTAIEKLEEAINQKRGECKYKEMVFPELPECSEANKYGFPLSPDDNTVKPCLYLNIKNADKFEPAIDGDSGKPTESYSVLCRSLLFRSKNSTMPENALTMAVFPPDALKKKVYPLQRNMTFCNPIIAVQLDLEDLRHYARAEIECEIFVEESTAFDRRKAELKLDINLGYDDSADALLQNVLDAIKENSESLGALEGNRSFVAKVEELKEELANSIDGSHLNYTFAPSEQHLTALEKAIEEYLMGHNSTHILTQAESKREHDLKTVIAERIDNFLENARSNHSHLRQTLYNMEQQIDEVTPDSSEGKQTVILKQVKDILQSLSRQKGDRDFEQALVRLATPLLITLEEFSKLETRDPRVDDAAERTRNLLNKFVLKKVDEHLDILYKDNKDPKVSPGKKRKIKRIITIVERLKRKLAEMSNTTDDKRQLSFDYEEQLRDIETERSAVLINGSEEQSMNEQRRELNRLLNLVIPKPNQGLESIDQTLEKMKEDLEDQVALVPTAKKRRKIKQIITIIDYLKKRPNSTELNETLAEQLLKDIEKSFVLTDHQLNELINKLDDLSGTVASRSESADLEDISKLGTTICTTMNGYNCTIADEEEALALLHEIWKSDNKSIFDNEDVTEKVDELVELLQQRNDLEEDQETFLSRAEEDLEKTRLKNKKKKIIKKVLELHEYNKTAYPIPPGMKEILENISQESSEAQPVSSSLEGKYDKIIELLAHLNESSGISELLVRVENEEKREVERIVKDLLDFISSELESGIPLKGRSYDKKAMELLTEITNIKERVADASKNLIGNVSSQLMKKADTSYSMKDFVQNITDILGIKEDLDRPIAFKQFLEDIVKINEESDLSRVENQKAMKQFLKEIISLDEQKQSDWKDAIATAKVEIEKKDVPPYIEQFIEKASLLLGISTKDLVTETSPAINATMNKLPKNKTKALQGQESKDKLIQIISNAEPFVKNENLSARLAEEKHSVHQLPQQEDISESFTKVADILVTELESVQEQQAVIEDLLNQLNKSESNASLHISETLRIITDEIETRILSELSRNNSDDYSNLFRTQNELMNMVINMSENISDLGHLLNNLAETKSILNRNSFKELATTVEELKEKVSNEISARKNTEKLRDVVEGDQEDSAEKVYNAGMTHLLNTTNNREELKRGLLEVMNDINNSNASLSQDQKVKVLRSLLEEVRAQQPNETEDSELSLKHLNLRAGVPNILLKRIGNILENTTSEDPTIKSTIKQLINDLEEDNNNELLQMIMSNAKPSDRQKGQSVNQNVFQRKLSEFEEAVAKDPERGRKEGHQTLDDQRRNLGKDLEKLLRGEKLKNIENYLKYPSDMSLLLPTFQTLSLLKTDNVTCEGITMSKKNIEHFKNILRNDGLGRSYLFKFFDLLDSSQSGTNVTSQLHEVAVDVLHSRNSYTSLLSEKDLLDLIKRAAACSSKKIVDSLVGDLAMIQRMFTSRVFSEEMARQKMLACYPKLSLHLLDSLTFRYLTEALQTSKLLETFSVKVRSTLSSLVNDSLSIPAQEMLGRYLSMMPENETIQIEAERADQLRKILRTYQAAIISSTSLTQAKVDEILAKLDLTESLIRLSVKLSIVADSVSKILADKSSTEAKKISSLKLLYQKIEEAQLVLQLKDTPTINERLKDYLLEFKEKLEDSNQSCNDIENILASETTSVELLGLVSEATDGPSLEINSQIIPQNRTTDAATMCRLLQRTCPDLCKNLTMLLEIMSNEKTGTSRGAEDGDGSEEITSSLEDAENTNNTVVSSTEHLHDQSENYTEETMTSGQASTSPTTIIFDLLHDQSENHTKETTISGQASTSPTTTIFTTSTTTMTTPTTVSPTHTTTLTTLTTTSPTLITTSTTLAAVESTQEQKVDIDSTWLRELDGIFSSSNVSRLSSPPSETLTSMSMNTTSYVKDDTKYSTAGHIALTTSVITIATPTPHMHGNVTGEETTETGETQRYVTVDEKDAIKNSREQVIDYDVQTEKDASTSKEHEINETIKKLKGNVTGEETTETGKTQDYVTVEEKDAIKNSQEQDIDYDVQTEKDASTSKEHEINETIKKTEVDLGGFIKGGGHSSLIYNQQEERGIEHIERQTIMEADSKHHVVMKNTTKIIEADEEDETTADEEYEEETLIIRKRYDEDGNLVNIEHLSEDEFDNMANDTSTGIHRQISISETVETSNRMSHSHDDPIERERVKSKGQRDQGLHLGQVKGKQGTKH